MALPVPHRDEPVASYDERSKTVSVSDNWHRFFEQLGSSFATLFGSGSATGALGTAAYKNTGASGDAVPLLNVANTWSKSQTFDVVTLTDEASIAWDWSLGPIAKVTLGGNRALAAPTNLGTKAGTWSLFVRQDGTGSRTLSYDASYLFPNNGTDPVLSTNASALDVLTFVYDGTSIVGAISKRFA